MKPFGLSIGTAILRFYLMMGIVLLAGFSGIWLLSLFALPVVLSILLGVKIGGQNQVSAKVVNLGEPQNQVKKVS